MQRVHMEIIFSYVMLLVVNFGLLYTGQALLLSWNKYVLARTVCFFITFLASFHVSQNG